MIGIYARVSTEEQKTENQTQRLENWCKLQDKKYRIFEENVSGKSLKGRVQLEKMMKQLEAGTIDTVLVWDISRFGRSVIDLMQLLTRVIEAKGRFVSYANGLDISEYNPASKMMYVFLGAIAEFQREMISRNTKLGLARAKREGKILGRKVKQVDERKIIGELEKRRTWTGVMKEFGISRWKLAQIVNKWKGDEDERKEE